MEYVFGTENEVEVLKTKGSAHTNLTGFQQVERRYPDQVITDSFRVVRKLGSRVDPAGNCYDWYEIDRHYRFTDKTGPVVEATEQNAESITSVEDAVCELDENTDARISETEDAVCELDESTDARMGEIEDALCDLDAAINGGGEI